jgi:hypothetical protein
MNKEFINIKEQILLNQIKDILNENSINSTLIESSLYIPYNVLVATIDETNFNIMYLPIEEDYFRNIRLLQHYAILVENIPKELKIEISELINAHNNQIPLGFFYVTDENELSFKYVITIPRFDPINPDQYGEMFMILQQSVNQIKNKFLQFINGKLTFNQAIN